MSSHSNASLHVRIGRPAATELEYCAMELTSQEQVGPSIRSFTYSFAVKCILWEYQTKKDHADVFGCHSLQTAEKVVRKERCM